MPWSLYFLSARRVCPDSFAASEKHMTRHSVEQHAAYGPIHGGTPLMQILYGAAAMAAGWASSQDEAPANAARG